VTNVFVAVCSLFLAAQLVAAYRSPASPVTLGAPFAGDWYVLNGGASVLVNANRAVPGRHDAIDLTQLTRGRAYTGSGDRNADWNAFDAPILAPADGVVVTVSDDLPDHAPGTVDTVHPAGNVVVIALGAGRYLEVSQVERDSVIVTVGTRVTRGQAIARVGDSGDTTEPVLRMEVRDRAGSRTYPIVFRDVTVVHGGRSSAPAAAWLRRGDRLHAEAW
jgi:murein DD-endopeptidase MepM/ murein hydrolase activator NlpD